MRPWTPVPLAALLAVLALLPSPASARNEEGDWEVGIHLGNTRFIDTDVEDDSYWGLNFGYCFTDLFELALHYDSVGTEAEGGGARHDLDFLTLDLVFNFGEDAHKPYVLFGLGQLDRSVRSTGLLGLSSEAGDDADLIEMGLGYRGYFSDSVGVRLEARLSFTDDDGEGFSLEERDSRYSLGLAFSFRR